MSIFRLNVNLQTECQHHNAFYQINIQFRYQITLISTKKHVNFRDLAQSTEIDNLTLYFL